MLGPGWTVVVAVSGGVDSMALLHVLATLGETFGVRLHAAHLDHGLRGSEAERDAAAVAAWGKTLGVPVTMERAGPLDRRGGSLQRAARAARYTFLERVADQVGAHRIALGHTRDDVAETLLLNLLRGAGLRGLAGIPPVRGRLIRPFIAIPRESILAYARAQRVPWVEDSSNRSPVYRRNRIRAELIPALAKTYNLKVSEVLARTAAILRAEDAYLDSLAQAALRRSARAGRPGEAVLSRMELADLDPVLRRRVLRAALESLAGRPILSARHLAGLEAWLLSGPRPGRRALPRGVAAFWEEGDLVLAPQASPLLSPAVPLPVGVATQVAPFGMTFLAERLERGEAGIPPPAPGEVWLDAEAAPGGLAVRGWRFGDRFRPSGLGGSKKLQDFFVDAKVPRRARWGVPLLVSGEDILWVVGHRLDERARATPATRSLLRVTARPVD
jgi:tRNA(Ile)-lysidine synthase